MILWMFDLTLVQALLFYKRLNYHIRLTYILTVAGATIGFGATWRFPYLVGENGGGAYVLTFIIVMLLVGIPIILVENVIGRRAQSNSVDAFILSLKNKVGTNPLWKIVGYLGLLGAFGILAYYMVIGAWVISYIIHIFMGAFGISGGLDLSAPITKEITENFYEANIENAPIFITISKFKNIYFITSFCSTMFSNKSLNRH